MTVYKLYKSPNFKMSVSPEGKDYNLHFRYFQGLMYVTITDYDGVVISGPIRIVNGQWLILSQARNYANSGNFTIIDRRGHYPTFRHFNDRCELRYYPATELESLNMIDG